MYDSEYVPPTVTVDGVIFQLVNDVLHVALIQRSAEPFKGSWALPGGYNAAGETTREALERIVKRKAGISIEKQTKFFEQLFTFDTVARDPRGHAVSVTYVACGLNVVSKDAHEKTQFFAIDELPKLAYDHESIIHYAHERLISKMSYTNVVYSLIPEKFTWSDIQKAYEAVFQREFDKRNFRKKFAQLDLIKETDEFYQDGAHRPARLYVFKQKSLQTLVRNFD